MITPGTVRAVRELKRGVQAEVCLGSSVEHGSAIAVVTSNSIKVRAALEALKAALADEARTLTSEILAGQRAWDKEMSG